MKGIDIKFNSVDEIRGWLEGLLSTDGGAFWDPDGVLISYLNVRTLKPFTKEFCATQTQYQPPEPFGVDYVAGMTYEDSWDAMGNYLEYMVARYDVTGEQSCLDEMRRITQMAIDVYREDNPTDDAEDFNSSKGFWRRLYGGRYGEWPYPETLCSDQMAPLQFGLIQAYPHMDKKMQEELDKVLVGALFWYMIRNWVYPYRYTSLHIIEVGPHALSYYIPALVWADKLTGDPKYMKAYNELHQKYIYNPDFYLSDMKCPYYPIMATPEDKYLWHHYAFRWSMWIAWLSQNAPNAKYYDFLFDEFVEWNTRILKNSLPSGLGHDYDNMPPTTQRYPEQWIGVPADQFEHETMLDGWDYVAVNIHARMPPFRKLREHTYFAMVKPDKVDISPVAEILPLCSTPDHFSHVYDPDDTLTPPHIQWRSHAFLSQFACSWLAAYWRLKKLGAI